MGNSTIIQIYIGVYLIISLWELVKPRRKLNYSRKIRWTNNIGITLLNSLIMRLIFPILAFEIAVIAKEKGIGLFNYLSLPTTLEIILSVLILDFAIYKQHRWFHRHKYLIRIHKMHHTDLDIDITSSFRFHPLELIVSMIIKILVVVIVGISPISVMIFELFLRVVVLFNHGNIYIPPKVDRVLRWIVVTPDMHRIHHSLTPQERNSNFGFNIPWWDMIFKTYTREPKEGQENLTIGLRAFRREKYLKLNWLLAQPFLKDRDYKD